MSLTEIKTLKKDKIIVNPKNIKYNREDPHQLILKVERHDSCVEIKLIAVYTERNRYCSLGEIYALTGFASKKDIENLMDKVEKKAYEFRKETLDILVKGNYKLYLPDDGRMNLLVNEKPWRVPDNLALISS